MRLVIDTNVLLVSISPRSNYHWIFDNFIKESYTLCLTTDILLEYEEIIGRHMGEKVSDNVLQIIENAENTNFVTRYFYWNLIKTDPDDNKFIDCAIAAKADFIVSHDKHFNILSQIDFPKIKVVSVSEFKLLIKN